MIKLKIIPTVSDDYEKVTEGKDLDNNSWWYLHGDLETRVGYDKAVIYNMSDLSEEEYPESLKWGFIQGSDTVVSEFLPRRISKLEGVYPVEVYGIPEECIGYFWVGQEREYTAHLEESPDTTRKFSLWDQRGLVVLKSDIEGIKDARKKYENRSCNL